MLYFRSMCFAIIWALVICGFWALTAGITDKDLFRLGTKEIDTPRKLCAVTDWGYTLQHKLMWAKVLFVVFAYAWVGHAQDLER